MCGIAGIFGFEGAAPPRREDVEAMLATMVHRGPDGRNVELFGSCALGHARLAIIDLETGDQPQADASGRIQVVVNGEIYNYRELRADLEARGHVFRTRSDIEVIPHLYRERGLDFVDALRGMFAIALLDREAGRLVLVRDRLGKKPLYYARTGQGLAFGSEARGLDTLAGVDRGIDAEAVAHFLTWQYVPAPWTGRRGVRKLEPATMLVVEADGTSRSRRYFEDRPEVDPELGGEDLLDRLQTTLDAAADLRLRSDVPLAAFLSGGIDSGLVCASLARSAPDLEAITVRFRGETEDEGELTRATADHLGLRLHEEEVSLDLLETVGRVLGHLDEPLGDSSCVPTWIVCEAAARRVKVALSGDGGDEAFAGYPVRYGHNLATEGLRRFLPAPLRHTLVRALADIWPRSPRLPRPLRLGRVLENLSTELETAFTRDLSVIDARSRERLLRPEILEQLGDFRPEDWMRGLFDRVRDADPLSRMLYVDRHAYMGEGVLAKVDRMSMAHSLEVRSPLLDQELIGLATRIPPEEKLFRGEGKRCLRRLAARRLPEVVVRGKKKGFAPPIGGWMRGPLAPLFEERVLRPEAEINAFCRPEAVSALFETHRQGRAENGRALWMLLVLETWASRPAAVTMPA